MMRKVSLILALAGVLLVLYAVLGRFVGAQACMTKLVPPHGLAAVTVLQGANTCLLLSILLELLHRKKE